MSGQSEEKKCLVVGCDPELIVKLTQYLPDVHIDQTTSPDEGLHRLKKSNYGQLILDSRLIGSLEMLASVAADPTLSDLKRTVCLGRHDRVAPVLQFATEKAVSRIFYFPLDAREVARDVAQNLQTRIPAAPLFGTAPTDTDPAFEPLREKFRRATRQRVNRILDEYNEARTIPSHLRELEREAHRMMGSMGSFGYTEGSVLAERLETILQSSRSSAEEVTTLGKAILAEIEESETALVPQNPDLPYLMVVTDESKLATGMATRAAQFPVRTVLVPNAMEAREVAITNTLSGVVIDLRTQYDEGLSLISFLSRNFISKLVAILPVNAQPRTQVEVANAGAWRVVEPDTECEQLLSIVSPSTKRGEKSQTRILTVDDDPIFLAMVQSCLQTRGFKVHCLSDPTLFWEEVETTVPDLILLDVDMPQINGIELCRALRASNRWSDVPIIIVTSRHDADSRFRVYAAGADDYVVKPFIGPELCQRIENRLSGARAIQERADLDPLTGLLTRRKALSLMRRFLQMGERKQTPVSLSVIDLDHFKSVNDTYGHPAGDQVLVKLAELLTAALRSNDVVARWGGEEFVIGVFGLSKQSTAGRLRDILESLKDIEFSATDQKRFRVSFSGGVAQYPEDGLSVEDLYKSADEALYEAKRQGRSRVSVSSVNRQPGIDRYDVVIVEDDGPLAEVISDACQARCLSSRSFTSSSEYLNEVKARSLESRILILDFDLPGLDGLDLLLELRAAQHHPRVLMMSGKMTEEEILKAHDLGIHEHIPKPVFLSVLMRRVEKALNA